MSKVNVTLILNDDCDRGTLNEVLDIMSFDELFQPALKDIIKGIEIGSTAYYDGLIVKE